jgi:CHRD domain
MSVTELAAKRRSHASRNVGRTIGGGEGSRSERLDKQGLLPGVIRSNAHDIAIRYERSLPGRLRGHLLHVTIPLMKTSLVFGSMLGCLLLAGTASAAVTKYVATLNGAQENPAIGTAATGTANLELDDAAKTLKGKVTFSGLSGAPNAAHIHKGACGENGGDIFTLDPAAAEIVVDETLNDGQMSDLTTGNYYVNLHTAAHDGGEIRGQLYPEGSTKKCPAEGTDAGSSSGGVDSGTGSSGGTDGGNGASTVRPDAGSSAAPAAKKDDGGCSTAGSAPGGGLAIALGIGVALATMTRNRRKR